MSSESARHIVAGHQPKGPSDTTRAAIPAVRVDVCGLSHAGKVRERNEDHFLVMRIGRYLETVITSLPAAEMADRTDEVGYAMILADGMGGHAGGERASRLAITGLVKLALGTPDWIFRLDDTVAEDARQRSEERFRRLNSLLLDHGERDRDLRGMGTTLTAVRNMGRHLHIVHVGDSRAYLLRDESLHRLTRDHTYVQLLVDSGHLSEEEATRFHGRNILVNALGGSSEDVEVDVDQAELCNGDRILMCSDGLTDMIDDVAIRRVLIESQNSQQACERLLELALDRGGKDNVTIIVATYNF